MIDPTDMHLPYALPAALLAAALALKMPTLIRSWRDPIVRATWLFLFWATAVFLSVPPVSLHTINQVTGVPNIAAPWTYSLLTGFCASCLTVVITWRDAPSPRRRRTIRRVWAIYTAIIVALWVTFLMADVGEERIYDLDTYYATTPWMREHILLYLFAHLVSALVAAWMIWRWIPEVRGGWLKASLVFLQAGFAFGLVFDLAKFAAIGARWAGTDWDVLSTEVAPPFAILDATLVGVGFILPVVGPFAQKWPREQGTYWVLRPLAQALKQVGPSAAKARVSWFAPLDLRLIQRQQHIRDGLLHLRHFDHDLYQQAYRFAAAGRSETRARGLAGAVAIRAALGAHQAGAQRDPYGEPAQVGPEISGHINAISLALLLHPRTINRLCQRLTSTESATTHA